MTELERHLLSRGCDPKRYACHLDNEEFVATFMLYAPGTGKLVGYQQYRPFAPKTSDAAAKGLARQSLRYFTHDVEGELALFGTETLSMYDGPVYLVEGIFDAVKLHALGLACLAVLGNGAVPKRGVKGSPLQNQLRAMNRLIDSPVMLFTVAGIPRMLLPMGWSGKTISSNSSNMYSAGLSRYEFISSITTSFSFSISAGGKVDEKSRSAISSTARW